MQFAKVAIDFFLGGDDNLLALGLSRLDNGSAVDLVQARGELFITFGLEDCRDLPVFLRHKSLYFRLPLANESQRH